MPTHAGAFTSPPCDLTSHLCVRDEVGEGTLGGGGVNGLFSCRRGGGGVVKRFSCDLTSHLCMEGRGYSLS